MEMVSSNLCVSCMRKYEKEPEGGKCPYCGYSTVAYAPAAHHLPPGTMLRGRYLLGRTLGEGVYGITYVGKDLDLGTLVAIKEYFPEGYVMRGIARGFHVTPISDGSLATFTRGKALFLQQAETLARFAALPGIASVLAFFEVNGTAYQCMDYVQGVDAIAYAERLGGKIRPMQLLTLMQPVLSALDQVHAEGLPHLDICPENLMVDERGAMRLMDFGTARVGLAQEDEKTVALTLRHGYAAHEQYTPGVTPDVRADVYALCATMYRLLTGTKPQDARERARQDLLIAPSAFGSKVDQKVETALLKGMAVVAADRFPSLAAFRAALYNKPELKAPPLEAPAPTPTPPPPAPPKKRGGRIIAALLVLVLVMLGGVGAWWYFQGQGIAFEDLAFEAMLRAALQQPEGMVRADALAGITELSIDADAMTLAYVTPDAPSEPSDTAYGGITSLADLRHFPKLAALQVRDQHITDLAPIATRPALTRLSLLHCGVTDAAPLANLIGLFSLYMYDNQIVDVVPLTALPLATLHLDYNEVTNAAPLANMAGLQSLSLTGNPVADWTALANISNVTGRPEEMAPVVFTSAALEAMVREALLRPEGPLLRSDLAAIDNLSIVGDTLTLAKRSPDTYTPGTMGTLTDITDLGLFTGLRTLYLADNPIGDLSPLTGLVSLSSLMVGNCDVRSIEPLSSLTHLHTLALPNNRVQDLSPLSGLNLTQLVLDRNAIADISPLSGMAALGVLSITDNNVQDLSPVAGLSSLSLLRATGNPVSDWSAAAAVATVEGAGPTPMPFTPVTFRDAAFEKLLCEALGKPVGGVAPEDILSIDAMTIVGDALWLEMRPEAYRAGKVGQIKSLSDLSQFPALTQLHIADVATTDLSPLAELPNLENLLVGNAGVSDLAPLANATKLQSLYLYDNKIVDIAPLSGLSLETLGLSSNAVADVSPLAGMTTLQALYLSSNKVTDITPLAGLTALSALDLTGNPVADWTPLQRFAQVVGRPDAYNPLSFDDAAFEALLRAALGKEEGAFVFAAELSGIDTLAIRGDAVSFSLNEAGNYEPGARGGITSLADLQHFPALTGLHVQDQPIDDLAPLAGAKGLRTLLLGGLDASDLTPLSSLEQLASMYAQDTPVAQLMGLPAKKLTRLTISGGQLTDLSGLSGANALVALDVSSNQIADITPLSGLKNLETLSIAGNAVADLVPLAKLAKLTALDASDNPVADWSPVAHLPVVVGRAAEFAPLTFADAAFEKLLRAAMGRPNGPITANELSQIRAMTITRDAMTFAADDAPYAPGKQGTVASLADLQLFPALESLTVRDQVVGDLAPLSTLTELTHLTLTNCQVESTAPLLGLADLTELSLWDNRISALSPLPGGLTALWLSGNEIADISVLSSLAGLTQLYLDNNAIVDIGPLSQLTTLETLTLAENQVASLSALTPLVGITALDLTGNPVEDWSPVAQLADVSGRPAEYGPIVFADATFERLLRAAMAKPEGFIAQAELSGVTQMTIIGDTLSLTLAVPEAYEPGPRGTMTTLADLARFPALTDLYVQDQDARDLAPLAGLSALEYLSVNNGGASDLAPLAGLSGLRFLYLYDNEIEDLSPLTGLPLLRLALSRNHIANLKPLAGMTELTQLWLTGNRIEDIAPLSGLTSITHLYLTNNAVRDITPLSKLLRLKTVYLTGNPVIDWSPVARVPEVAGRTPENSPVTFEDATFERLLRAALNRPEGPVTAAELAAIPQLTIIGDTLSLSLAPPDAYVPGEMGTIGTLSDLRHFTGLTELYVSDQRVGSVSQIEALTGLTYLSLNHCEIVDIQPLEKLTALVRLYLYDNQAQDLAPLSGLPLIALGLSRNGIVDVAPLTDVTTLTQLWLSGNQIVDLGPLSKLTGLTRLYLTENQIADLAPLATLTALKTLAVSGNPIADFGPVLFVPEVIGLTENDLPIAFLDKAFAKLLRAALGKADGASVTARDLDGITELTIDGDTMTLAAVAASLETKKQGSVKDLTDLSHFPKLTRLIVRNEPVSDLTPVTDLTQLTYLAITNCEVKALEPLSGLALSRLGLADNRIGDVTPLAALSGLTHLYLGGNDIEDISPLSALTALEELNLMDNRIWDLSPLSALPLLMRLYVSGNPVKDWSAVVNVPSVHGRPESYVPIQFEDTAFEAMLREALSRPDGDILPVQLSGITAMTLAGDSLWLSLAPPPTAVTLAEGPVRSLADLRHFANLTQLYVRQEPLVDIAPVAGLTKLTYLNVSECGISDLTPLAALPLDRLGLYGNRIVDISPLAEMKTVSQLFLGANQIEDLGPLKGLKRLTQLNIVNNLVKDLGPLEGVKTLTHLYLGGNPVEKWDAVKDVPYVYGP